MARIAFSATVGALVPGQGRYSVASGQSLDPSVSTASAVALQATLDAAQAAAVAKGTSDAHVEIAAVGVALTAYEAAVNSANTLVGTGDVIVSFKTTVTTNQLKSAFAEILRAAAGSDTVTQ